MESNSGSFDFVKEFAKDSREILDGLREQVDKERSMNLDGLEGSRLGFALQDIQAIKGSAEFLGLDAPIETCSAVEKLISRLAALPRLTDEEMDIFFHVLERLDDLFKSLEEDGLSPNLEHNAQDLLLWLRDYAGMEVAESESTGSPSPTQALSEPTINENAVVDFPEDFKITITPEMVATFMMEAEEQLETVESSLLGMEKNLSDKEALDAAFRGVHTLKGNCGLFNYSDLEKLGHNFESILEDVKSGTLSIDQKGISLLLKVLDVMKSTIAPLPDGDGKIPDLNDYLRALADYQSKGHVAGFVEQGSSSLLGEILVEIGAVSRENLDLALSRQAMPIGEVLRGVSEIPNSLMEKALDIQRERRKLQSDSSVKKRTKSQNIRVDLFKLDALMNLVGELIIAENMVTHNPDLEGYAFENFKKSALDLNRITRELQDIAMSLRMIPIEATFRKMDRVVRDVSQKQSKSVTLTMVGEDTEVDKSVAENIANPLLHLLRNAIDHGIEPPDEREAVGKPRTGQVSLEAFHDGGDVVILIRDDGRGMDPERILAKAREKGLIEAGARPETLAEVYSLIFEPGFSTAEKVTDISGRGVGMDVVRRSVEKIKGRITIRSEFGSGTTFIIRIPLTLAIIEGMLIRVKKQLFTIPLLSVKESMKIDPAMITRTIDGREVARIRERLLPILRLHELFRLEPDFYNLHEGILVILEHQGKQVCLFADEIIGQFQTVIKGLSRYLGMVRGISGSAIMSNGDISLILDIPGLAALAADLDT